ncbi:MAG: hypothetical protein H7A53_08930 [Akkermansiaceae bacterium]|nr:hypothetical protein [Akkermansiaceae bacterium]
MCRALVDIHGRGARPGDFTDEESFVVGALMPKTGPNMAERAPASGGGRVVARGGHRSWLVSLGFRVTPGRFSFFGGRPEHSSAGRTGWQEKKSLNFRSRSSARSESCPASWPGEAGGAVWRVARSRCGGSFPAHRRSAEGCEERANGGEYRLFRIEKNWRISSARVRISILTDSGKVRFPVSIRSVTKGVAKASKTLDSLRGFASSNRAADVVSEKYIDIQMRKLILFARKCSETIRSYDSPSDVFEWRDNCRVDLVLGTRLFSAGPKFMSSELLPIDRSPSHKADDLRSQDKA